MSDEVKTFVINDSRIANITDEILVGVKKGPSSSVCRKFKQVSNSSNTVKFAMTPNSENTLIDRSIKIKSTLTMSYVFGLIGGAEQTINIIPSSFPLNTAISTCNLSINDTTLTSSSQEVNEILKKTI